MERDSVPCVCACDDCKIVNMEIIFVRLRLYELKKDLEIF